METGNGVWGVGGGWLTGRDFSLSEPVSLLWRSTPPPPRAVAFVVRASGRKSKEMSTEGGMPPASGSLWGPSAVGVGPGTTP